MIRRLAAPPAGWNGRWPAPPAGALAVNEVNQGGPKLAAYWDDDDPRAMTDTAWAAYVATASYSPTAEESNEQTIRTQIGQALVTLQAIIDTAAPTVTTTPQAQAAIRGLQAQVKDEARILRRVLRLLAGDFSSAD